MNLQKFFRQAGFEIRRYSGRGMYGKECVGIEYDAGLGQLFADCLEAFSHSPENKDYQLEIPAVVLEDLAEAFREMRTDALGRGTIVYFPSVAWEEGELTVGRFAKIRRGEMCDDCGVEPGQPCREGCPNLDL